MPGANPELSPSLKFGSAWAVPGEARPLGPNRSLGRGARGEGVGIAARGMFWGSPGGTQASQAGKGVEIVRAVWGRKQRRRTR